MKNRTPRNVYIQHIHSCRISNPLACPADSAAVQSKQDKHTYILFTTLNDLLQSTFQCNVFLPPYRNHHHYLHHSHHYHHHYQHYRHHHYHHLPRVPYPHHFLFPEEVMSRRKSCLEDQSPPCNWVVWRCCAWRAGGEHQAVCCTYVCVCVFPTLCEWGLGCLCPLVWMLAL